jgi:hypothetical protein
VATVGWESTWIVTCGVAGVWILTCVTDTSGGCVPGETETRTQMCR